MARMTKRYFEALADELKMSRARPAAAISAGHWRQWRADVRAVARACAALNSNFNQSRFFERAGYDEE